MSRAEAHETTRSSKNRTPTPVALYLSAFLLFLQVALYLFLGVGVYLAVLGEGTLPSLLPGGLFSGDTFFLVIGGLLLAFGVLGLVVITGLFLKQKWAWAAAMTWATVSLVQGLASYFGGAGQYWSMLIAIVTVLALNRATVQQAFAKGIASVPPAVSVRDGETLAAPANASPLELLRTFEPVLRFTKGERFYPTDVDRYVARSSLWVRRPGGQEEMLVKRGGLDLDKLAQHRDFAFGTVEHLRFNDTPKVAETARVLAEVRRLRRQDDAVFRPGLGRLARVGFLPRVVDAIFSLSLLARGRVDPIRAAVAELEYHRMTEEDPRNVYYGRVVRRGGWTVLQYWFFYCYNSWRSGYEGANDHESDWENILVYLYEEDGRLYPEWAGYASHDFHGDDLRRRWDDEEQLALEQGHPVVWVGAGSHASYFQRGEYQAKVALPVPRWIRAVARWLSFFWNRVLGQGKRAKDPLRIPFVDFARGDGRTIGPGQDRTWEPVVIDESTPWVGRYRGLWGFFANDPTSGENAPAGPMYERNGEPRRSWYDPLGFVGLDKVPPPPTASGLLSRDCRRIQERRADLEGLISRKLDELRAVSTEMSGMEGNPNLADRYNSLSDRMDGLGEELRQFQRESTENEAVLEAMHQRIAMLEAGQKADPRAHIGQLAQPVQLADIRFNRTAEAWGAVSLSFILLAIVALLLFARSHLWIGLLVMIGAVLLLESIIRGHYARTVAAVAAPLAILSAVLFTIHYWVWVIALIIAGVALYLLVQKLRELWN